MFASCYRIYETDMELPVLSHWQKIKRLFTPRRSPSSAVPLHTQKQCTARRSSWGSSIPVSDH